LRRRALNHKRTILVIDDEESLRFTFSMFLEKAGHKVYSAKDYTQAMLMLRERDYDLVISDIILGQNTGLDILKEVKEKHPRTIVIMVTGYPNVESASEAVRLGAFDYISKPVKENDLLRVTKIALRQKALEDRNREHLSHTKAILNSIKEAIITFSPDGNLISSNPAARRLLELNHQDLAAHFTQIAALSTTPCVQLIHKTLEEHTPQEMQRVVCKLCSGNKAVSHTLSCDTTPMLDDNNHFLGVVLIIRDETRIATLESDLKKRRKYRNIIGDSAKMQEVYTMLDHLKDQRTTVLICGETGTGKELVVDALHHSSTFNHRPLVKVNCAALPESLLESELFGHVKGAFTGAVSDKIGHFQMADGGTIMLDEIGDISPRMQLRLLRILQAKEFQRVGDNKTIKVDVRVVAATNQDLRRLVQEKIFREDLFYRLNVVQLTLPPLREKRQDIPLLVSHFISRYNKVFAKDIVGVTKGARDLLLTYDWPGNVRELENSVEHAFVVCRDSLIDIKHLPENLQQPTSNPPRPNKGHDERRDIIECLNKTDWNKAKAARLLGVSRQTLYRRIIEYEIVRDDSSYSA